MNYKDINDNEVLYLIGESNEDAVSVLYDKYRPIILSLARKYFKRAKSKGLEYMDLVQEGYLGLERAIRSFHEEGDSLFYTFACICIEREMFSLVRRNSAYKHEFLNTAVSLDEEIPGTTFSLNDVIMDKRMTDPFDVTMHTFQEERLIDFKNSLSELEGQIFELRYHGFSYKEISCLLDIDVKTIDNSLFRLRNKFRKYWNDNFLVS